MEKTGKDQLCAEILSLEQEIEDKTAMKKTRGLNKKRKELKALYLKLKKMSRAEKLHKDEIDYTPFTW